MRCHTEVWIFWLSLIFSLSENLASEAMPGEDSKPEDKGLTSLILNPYQPDGQLETLEIIRRHGYPAETHIVQTQDGYLLEMHRIPHGRNRTRSDPKKKPVLLVHGFIRASTDWFLQGEKGLAFLLADKGYDVWMANLRGNKFSLAHVEYSIRDDRFWNFTFHEMGLYDAPASIDFILNYTQRSKLSFVGHSAGTTVFYVMASERPEYNRKIAGHISLAPLGYVGRTKSSLALLAPFAEELKAFVDPFTHGQLLPHDEMTRTLTKLFCDINRIENAICQGFFFTSFGVDIAQTNLSVLSNNINQNPSGSSSKMFVHHSQLIRSGKFRQYDYFALNQVQYNSPQPPSYNLAAITSKVVFIRAGHDLLCVEEDVKQTYSELGNPSALFRVGLPQYNHDDFVNAKDARSLVYDDVADILGYFDRGAKVNCAKRRSIVLESCGRANLGG